MPQDLLILPLPDSNFYNVTAPKTVCPTTRPQVNINVIGLSLDIEFRTISMGYVTNIRVGTKSHFATDGKLKLDVFMPIFRFPQPIYVHCGQDISVELLGYPNTIVSGFFSGVETTVERKPEIEKTGECVFCGKHNVYPQRYERIGPEKWAIFCFSCGGQGPKKPTIDDAWIAWNEAFDD